MAGLAVAAVIFGAAEFGVRALVPEEGPQLISPLGFQRHTQPITSTGPTPNSVVFGGPNIVTSKEPVGLRIFFFGGSATEGYHMTPYSSFAGWYPVGSEYGSPIVPVGSSPS